MGACLNYTTTLISQTCISCGVQFAMPKELDDRLQKTHTAFYCPNGHSQSYIGETPEQKQIKKLEQDLRLANVATQTARDARAEAERDALTARQLRGKAEAANKRLKHRVACGVCPHCHRTFKQLAAHMLTKHPEAVAQ